MDYVSNHWRLIAVVLGVLFSSRAIDGYSHFAASFSFPMTVSV